ncbi:MAG: antitoxin VapB family protein [Thermoplasmatota archaeon]
MTRQVSLAEATYARLRRNRRADESFSKAIDRLLDAQMKDPMAFAGSLPKAPLPPGEWVARIEADRNATRLRA